MGWSSGSYLANDVWLLVRNQISATRRKRIALKVIELFDSHDADDWDGDLLIVKDADLWKERGWDE